MNTRQFILICRILLAILVCLPPRAKQDPIARTLADELDAYEQQEANRS